MLPLLLAALMEPAVSAPMVLSAADRIPAAIVVLTPFGSATSLGTSRLVRDLGEVLLRRTDLRPLSSEQAGVDPAAFASCPAREQLTCWTRQAADSRLEQGAGPRYLFVVAARRIAPARDSLTITLIDPSITAPITEGPTADDIEDAYFRTTPRTRPIVVDRREGKRGTVLLDQIVVETFEDRWTKDGHWQPFGRILVSYSDCQNCEVLVDDRLAGISGNETFQIHGLRAGPHAIALRQNRQTILRCLVHVTANRLTTISASACQSDPDTAKTIWFRYGGVVATAAGIGLITYGALQAANAPRTVCLVPAGGNAAACDSLGAPGLGFGGEGAITDRPQDVNPSGVPTAGDRRRLTGCWRDLDGRQLALERLAHVGSVGGGRCRRCGGGGRWSRDRQGLMKPRRGSATPKVAALVAGLVIGCSSPKTIETIPADVAYVALIAIDGTRVIDASRLRTGDDAVTFFGPDGRDLAVVGYSTEPLTTWIRRFANGELPTERLRQAADCEASLPEPVWFARSLDGRGFTNAPADEAPPMTADWLDGRCDQLEAESVVCQCCLHSIGMC